MEEEKLLRLLILIIINLITGVACATDFDQEWAQGLAKDNHAMVMENFKEMMKMKGFDRDLRESVLKPRPVLQIFVSSSMQKPLLKAYAKEASRYGGVLVFRGLPQGSFLKLTDLVMSISDEQNTAPMQIDDEAFTSFGIKTVPTIVLSKPLSMFSEQTLLGNFDKVAGNITIKAALEIFARQGELAASARELLK